MMKTQRRTSKRHIRNFWPRVEQLERIESPTGIVGQALAVPAGEIAETPPDTSAAVAVADLPGPATVPLVQGPLASSVTDVTAQAPLASESAPSISTDPAPQAEAHSQQADDESADPAPEKPASNRLPWQYALEQSPVEEDPLADPFSQDGLSLHQGGYGYTSVSADEAPASTDSGGGGGGGDSAGAGDGGGGGGGGGGADDSGGSSSGGGSTPASTTSSNTSASNTAGSNTNTTTTTTSDVSAGGTTSGSSTDTSSSSTSSSSTTGSDTTSNSVTTPPVTPAFQPPAQPGLRFVANVGQTDSSVKFTAHSGGANLFLTNSGAYVTLARTQDQAKTDTAQVDDGSTSSTVDALALSFNGVGSDARIVGQNQLLTNTNYFYGNDSSQWYADAPNYQSVSQELYPGVSVAWHGNTQNQPEFDVQVAPGADPSQVHLSIQGAQSITPDESGNLQLTTAGGTLTLDNPTLYQNVDGQQQSVTGSFQLNDDGSIGFQVGNYDASVPLVIDPVLEYSSYFGGSSNDQANAVAATANGDIYMVGTTSSSNLPVTSGVFQSTLSGSSDVFVSKFSSTGQLLWDGYLGGSAADSGLGAAVDAAGNLYVTGQTYPNGGTGVSDFPTTNGAFRSALHGTFHAFATKIAPSGDALLYSTLIGTNFSNGEIGNAIAVDPYGQAFVAGIVYNDALHAFPTTVGAFQTTYGGGASDAFILELNSTGTSSVFGSYHGGTGDDTANGVALDSSGNMWMTGTISSSGTPTFPTTAFAAQSTYGGGSSDAFITKVASGGASRAYSSFLGGSAADVGMGIAVDPITNFAYATGGTFSTNFPVTGAPYQGSNAGSEDAYVLQVNTLGTPGHCTYLGGTLADQGNAITVDKALIAITGSTSSTNFPTASATQGSSGGGQDVFIADLTKTLGSVSYSTYYGGSSTDAGLGIAADLAGDNIVVGSTSSTNLPTVNPYQGSLGGGTDAFLAIANPTAVPAPAITGISSDSGSSGSDFITNDQTLTISGTGPASGTITLYRAGLGAIGTASVSSGTWSFNYTGTTLPEGTYGFWATATVSSVTSVPSATKIVTVDTTAPTVTVSLDSTITSLGPVATVIASDAGGGVPDGTTVYLDVDLNNDGDFLDAGESGYASGTLTSGKATIKLPNLSGTGSYHVRARVTDLAGNTQTTSAQAFTVSSSSWSISDATVRSSDPNSGMPLEQLGDVAVSHPLDLDLSPGTAQSGNPALVYNSDSVHVRPIVQATLASDNSTSLPATIGVKLVWNSSVQTQGGTVDVNGFRWLSTTGLSPGDLITIAAQVDSPVGSTGRYAWTITVQANGTNYSQSGASFVRVEDSSVFGAGVSLSIQNKLVAISASGGYPAGMLWLYGTGEMAFFADNGSGGYTSPAGDAGTLAVSGSNYVYTSPQLDTITFNSNGTEANWTSPDGLTSMSFSYTSGNLTGFTAIDGTSTTINYTSGLVSSIVAPGAGTYTITVNGSGNLTQVGDPDSRTYNFTYNSNHQLTDTTVGTGSEQLEQSWTYDATSNIVTGGVVGNNTSPSTWSIVPAAACGLASLYAGTVMAKSTDALGRVSWTQLDDQGRILASIDPNGGSTKYTRDVSTTWVTGITDPLGNSTGYHWDAYGDLTQVDLPDGTNHEYYTYDSTWHTVHTYEDANGHITETDYDAGTGHITKVIDASLNETDYSVSGTTGLVTSITDASSNVTSFTYDGYLRLSSMTTPLGTEYYTYDAHGNVATYQDARSKTYTYTEDVLGRFTQLVDPNSNTSSESYTTGGLPKTSTDGSGMVETPIYDSNGRGIALGDTLASGTTVATTNLIQIDANAETTGVRDANALWGTTGYQITGNGESDTGTDTFGNTNISRMDLNGNALSSRDELGFATKNVYNADSEQTSFTDTQGQSWGSSYDANGNLLQSTDPYAKSSSITLTATDQLSTMTDELTNSSSADYYANGFLKNMTDPLGIVTHSAYNWASKQITVTGAYGTGLAQAETVTVDANGNTTAVQDALSHSTTFTVNNLNQTTGVTDALSHTSSVGLDQLGRVTSMTDALSKTTTLTLDKLGQEVKTTDPNGNSVQTMYDPNGNVVESIDGLGRVSKTVYNDLEQVAYQIDPLGGVTAYRYDAGGNLIARTDADNNTTTWVYNGAGQKLSETLPTGGTFAWSYDNDGRVASQVDPLSREIDYTYFDNGQLKEEVWKNSGGTTVNTQDFTYDDDGRVLTASDNNGTITNTYDDLGRLATQEDVYGITLTYTWDLGDRLTGVSDTKGGSETLGYDNANRLTSLSATDSTLSGQLAEAFSYSNRDQVTEVDRYSDSSATTLIGKTLYGYDDGGRTTSITHKNAAGTVTLDSFNYTYDAANEITQETSTLGPTRNYTYDLDGQLTGDGTSTYAWDANGNSTLAGRTTGTGNELSTDGTWNYTYDAVGNETQRTNIGTGEVWLYGYDNLNRMVQAQHKPSSGGAVDKEMDYKYDVINRRIEQDWYATGPGGSATVTKFAYDKNGNAILDMDTSLNVQARHLYLDAMDALFARFDGSGTFWYLNDYLSPRDITDNTGTLKDHWDYTSSGSTINETHSAFSDRYKWTDREWSAELSLQYNRARWYDPNTQRWLSQDPLGYDAGDSNLYRYVHNSPTSSTDPTGLIGYAEAQECLRKAEKDMQKTNKANKSISPEMAEKALDDMKDVHQAILSRILEKNLTITDDAKAAYAGPTAAKYQLPPSVDELMAKHDAMKQQKADAKTHAGYQPTPPSYQLTFWDLLDPTSAANKVADDDEFLAIVLSTVGVWNYASAVTGVVGLVRGAVTQIARITPQSLGITSIAQNAGLLRHWNNALRTATNSPLENATKTFWNILQQGGQPTADEARAAYVHVRRIFRGLVGADPSLSHIPLDRIHHWNWNIGLYPQHALDPRNLFPLTQPQHAKVHRLTTIGPHPTIDPIDPNHALPLDGAWPWTPP